MPALLCFFNVCVSFIRRVKVSLKPIENEDEDVERERQRIERGGGTNDILRLNNLTKVSFELCATSRHLPVEELESPVHPFMFSQRLR